MNVTVYFTRFSFLYSLLLRHSPSLYFVQLRKKHSSLESMVFQWIPYIFSIYSTCLLRLCKLCKLSLQVYRGKLVYTYVILLQNKIYILRLCEKSYNHNYYQIMYVLCPLTRIVIILHTIIFDCDILFFTVYELKIWIFLTYNDYNKIRHYIDGKIISFVPTSFLCYGVEINL